MNDNHYGDFQYGTSHVYGASSTGELEALAWAIEVDWDGDGVFDGTNEADHLIAAPRIVRGRRTMLRPSGQGFEPVRTGTATFTLSNHDGKYDAWNTASPLYPNVDAGKDVRIRVLDQFTGIIYTRFYGIVHNIEPVGYGADAKVIIRCDDAFRVLRDTQTIAQRPYTDGTLAPAVIDSCIGTLLDAVQWPTRWGRNLDPSVYGIRYWYSSGDRSVAVEAEDIAQSFFGYFFITADGKARFIDRNYDPQTSVETISQTEMLKDIGNPQPWSIRRNVVKLRFAVRKSETDAIVWEPIDTDPAIGPGETREVFIEYTTNGYPAYLENIEKNIRFSQSPYEITVGVITVAYTLTDYGTRAFLSFTNNNAFPIYVYMAHDQDALIPTNQTYVRGDITWTEKNDTISNPRNPATVANQRSLVLESLWYQDKNQAYDFVDNYQPFISASHKTPIIQIENRFAKQFTPELFNTVTIDIPYLGISSEKFHVGGIEEEPVGESTQAVRTTFYLEPIQAPIANVWKWDTSVWDTGVWGW